MKHLYGDLYTEDWAATIDSFIFLLHVQHSIHIEQGARLVYINTLDFFFGGNFRGCTLQKEGIKLKIDSMHFQLALEWINLQNQKPYSVWTFCGYFFKITHAVSNSSKIFDDELLNKASINWHKLNFK